MRFILVHWKEKNQFEAYRTLTSFIANNPTHGFNYYTIDSYVGRKQMPYVDDLVTIQRLEMQGKSDKKPQNKAIYIQKKTNKSVKKALKL